jgi:hypothetical protein
MAPLPRRHIRFVEKFVHAELREWHHRGEWFTAPLAEIKKAIYRASKELPRREAEQDAFIARTLMRNKAKLEEIRKSRADGAKILKINDLKPLGKGEVESSILSRSTSCFSSLPRMRPRVWMSTGFCAAADR